MATYYISVTMLSARRESLHSYWSQHISFFLPGLLRTSVDKNDRKERKKSSGIVIYDPHGQGEAFCGSLLISPIITIVEVISGFSFLQQCDWCLTPGTECMFNHFSQYMCSSCLPISPIINLPANSCPSSPSLNVILRSSG